MRLKKNNTLEKPSMISASFDQESYALYVKLEKKKIAKTLTITNDILLDIDNTKNIVGLEILFSKKTTKQVVGMLKRSKSIKML